MLTFKLLKTTKSFRLRRWQAKSNGQESHGGEQRLWVSGIQFKNLRFIYVSGYKDTVTLLAHCVNAKGDIFSGQPLTREQGLCCTHSTAP